MADQFLSPHLKIARSRFRYIPSVATSRGLYSGALQAAALGGDRIGCSLEFIPMQNTTDYAERAALVSQVPAFAGPVNPVWMADTTYTRRGSFPAVELLTNNTFSNGTTNWSISAGSLRVVDRVVRATRSEAATNRDIRNDASFAVTAYAPYVARVMALAGRGTMAYRLQIGTTTGNDDLAVSGTQTAQGLKSLMFVPPSTPVYFSLWDGAGGRMAGDYMQFPYVSVARCAIVDNAPNYLLQSDEFDTTWTATRASVDDGAIAPPFGSDFADSIIEDNTASNSHQVSQTVTVPAAAADFAFGVALKAGARTFALLKVRETTGNTDLDAYVNLSTGAFGTVTAGANWANARVASADLGDGWFYFCVIARKTNAATGLAARISLATGSTAGSDAYSGNGTSNIYAWRAALAQASVPMRLGGTTVNALTSGTSQTGDSLYLRGLPASTNDLLMIGDQIEVEHSSGSSVHFVTAPLDSDAAGRGFVQFAPRIRKSPADGAVVHIFKPMGRFACVSESPEWLNEPGVFTTASLEFEEA